ncbi:MAG TPA: hypothetical protein VL381_05040 [Rhodocyclaceae bacterium]|jgi:hypothetical protein|nr:hypothetical protein [Rhodocyclaceae bacterium]
MEFLLLCIDIFAVFLLLWGIVRSQKKDGPGNLGLLMYRDDVSVPDKKKGPPDA